MSAECRMAIPAADVEDLKKFHENFTIGSETPEEQRRTSDGSSSSSERTRKLSDFEEEKQELLNFHESFKLGDEQQQNSFNHSISNGLSGKSRPTRQAPQTLKIASPINKQQQQQQKQPISQQTISTKQNSRRRRKGCPPVRPAKFEMRYMLTEEVLGSGARSSVSTCQSRRNGNEYAVKIVKTTSSHERDRVLREVEILHACRDHSNIIQLIDFFEDEGKFHLVLEKMTGPLLAHIQKKERFTEKEASEVTREVCSALVFLHGKGIAHRDLKPENILCERGDKVTPIKICDFDLSSMVSPMTTPITTPLLMTPVGSAEFMAPEILSTFDGDIFAYDKKCDLWSLGVILYMMLSGRPPFYGRCGRECGWERGEECEECQSMLLQKIKTGDYSLDGKEWSTISESACDLISRMLECDVEKRLSAVQVLNHPWVSQKMAPETPLATPGILRRNMSIPGELSIYAASCLRCTRNLSRDFSFTVSPSNCTHANIAQPFTLSPPGSSELAVRRTTNLVTAPSVASNPKAHSS